jgi:hypothetical protein
LKKKIIEAEKNLKDSPKNLKPFLYKLSAFECQAKKVFINNTPIILPMDKNSN